MSVKRSPLWQYFVKNTTTGTCKIFLKDVLRSGNTTNLRKHLQRNHLDIYLKFLKSLSSSQTQQESEEELSISSETENDSVPSTSTSSHSQSSSVSLKRVKKYRTFIYIYF
ncbi:hypothetical protein ALC60_13101 [Trachymyrmex zeteki]|uniref:BED-type domain-containing protein n=1 Tax=Mycetomoellerius zeteki TaxID=64791 RepID=A0A151WJG5_9HYME|nr:hypothetical protein ALC60_13101 [Trachymyrmex zeteki]